VDKVELYKDRDGKQHEVIVVTATYRHHHRVVLQFDRVPANAADKASGSSPSVRIENAAAYDIKNPQPARDYITIGGPKPSFPLANTVLCLSLDFSNVDPPVSILEIVTLAHAASLHFPNYQIAESQCYWFAAQLFRCISSKCPTAVFEKHTALTGTYLKLFKIIRDANIDPFIPSIIEKASKVRADVNERVASDLVCLFPSL
jgi:hypothetical protein